MKVPARGRDLRVSAAPSDAVEAVAARYVHAQIHVQVLLGLLDGRGAQGAVDAPRWIVGGMEVGERDDMIRIEDGCDASARAALSRATLKARTVPRGSEWLGHAQAIWLDGGPDAGSDFRANGAAAVSRGAWPRRVRRWPVA